MESLNLPNLQQSMLVPSNTQQKDYFGQIRCDEARQFYEKYYPDFKFFGYSLVDFSFYLNKGEGCPD